MSSTEMELATPGYARSSRHAGIPPLPSLAFSAEVSASLPLNGQVGTMACLAQHVARDFEQRFARVLLLSISEKNGCGKGRKFLIHDRG